MEKSFLKFYKHYFAQWSKRKTINFVDKEILVWKNTTSFFDRISCAITDQYIATRSTLTLINPLLFMLSLFSLS